MVENFAILHVLGVTTDGKVWHTMRSPTGWTAFTQIPNLPGPAVDVACVRRVAVPPETAPTTDGLWAFIAFENAPPQLRFRNSNTSQWDFTVPANILPLPIATRVAVTVSPGVAPANDPTNPGGPRAYVHLVAVANGVTPQDQGRLIAAIMPNRGPGALPSAIAEVQTSGAGDLGRTQAVALAPAEISPFNPVPLESVAVLAAVFPDPDGALFFTEGGVSASGTTGQWSPFRARDLAPPSGPGARPGRVEDIALVRAVPSPSPMEHMGIVRGGGDSDIYGAGLLANGWSAWDNFEIFRLLSIVIDTEPGAFSRVDMSMTTEGLHVLGVDALGRMFHQLRTPQTPAAVVFRDVELAGVFQDVGAFIAVACG
jgi:hypothetical protein